MDRDLCYLVHSPQVLVLPLTLIPIRTLILTLILTHILTLNLTLTQT